MALTPEHILNKHFQTTQFRKGYDERDVDDFLDEVVAEVRSLIAQRDDLTQQLNECRAARGLPAVPAAGTRTDARADTTTDAAAGRAGTDAETKLAALRQRIADAEEQERQLQDRIAHARAEADAAEKDAAETDAAEKDAAETEAAGTVAPEPPGASAGADRDPALEDDGQGGADPGPEGTGGAGAAGLMQLAQRVHDEHVAEGATRRDELIGEGQSRHDELVTTAQSRHDELVTTAQSRHDELVTTAQSRHDALLAEATALHEQMIAEARERSTGMVADAQLKKAKVLEELAHEKGRLERTIEELRTFERNYRTQLKSYLQEQLSQLDHTGAEVPDGTQSADGAQGEAVAETAGQDERQDEYQDARQGHEQPR